MNKIYSLFVRFLVVLLAFQGSLAALLINTQGAQASAAPGVIINEIMWMGTSSSSSDEWIELRNTTASPVDIGGWQLTNSSSELMEILTIPTGATIVANGFYLISRFDAANSELAVEPDFLANVAGNQLEIDDSCDEGTATFVRLENPFPTDPPTVIDQSGCDSVGGNPLAGVDGVTKKAMERNLVVANGLLSSSWHDSVQQVNLDLEAVDYASPRASNEDVTSPIVSEVRDGIAGDADITQDNTTLSANWDSSIDPESGIEKYQYAIDTVASCDTPLLVWTDTGMGRSFTESGLNLDDGRYFVCVRATNRQGLTNLAASDGIIVDATNTLMTGITLSEPVTPDNGDRLTATWTVNESEISPGQIDHFRIDISDLVGSHSVDVNGILRTIEITGLKADVDYIATVRAIDALGNSSQIRTSNTFAPSDELVPILDRTKIVVNQNRPGTDDTIFGQVGTSNEPNITAYIFYQDPAITLTTPIPVPIGPNGEFTYALSIGNNVNADIWVRLFDGTNTSIDTGPFLNDISGPVAPVLNQVVSSCPGESCQVTLNWTAGSSDTASYKVNYIVDGVESSTFELSATSLVLVLSAGKSYSFTVTGFDQYGNASLKSNSVNVALTKGVVSTVNSGGTTTTAISGSTEVISSDVENSTPAQFIPKAKAIDNSGDSVPKEEEKPLVQGSDNSRDWIRIFVVVILLLIIAGSFYALSRSVQETSEEEYDKKIVAAKSQKSKKRLAKRRHRRR